MLITYPTTVKAERMYNATSTALLPHIVQLQQTTIAGIIPTITPSPTPTITPSPTITITPSPTLPNTSVYMDFTLSFMIQISVENFPKLLRSIAWNGLMIYRIVFRV